MSARLSEMSEPHNLAVILPYVLMWKSPQHRMPRLLLGYEAQTNSEKQWSTVWIANHRGPPVYRLLVRSLGNPPLYAAPRPLLAHDRPPHGVFGA